jgi:hypothetical protein
MIKHFFSLIFILSVTVGLSQTLSAELEMPETVEPGSDFIVKVTVTKSNLNGFMKYYQKLPKNYIASNVDSKGGAFTFRDSIVKIIWLSPPAEDTYSFTYKLKVPVNAAADDEMVAHIDYTIDLKSFSFPLVNKTIKLTKPGTATTNTVVVEKVAETPPVVEKPVEVVTPPVVEKVVEATPPVVEKKVAVKLEENTYAVQIGAFIGTPKSNITEVRELKKIKTNSGITKYVTGNYATREEAEKRRDELKANGFNDAFIVKLKDGKIAE